VQDRPRHERADIGPRPAEGIDKLSVPGDEERPGKGRRVVGDSRIDLSLVGDTGQMDTEFYVIP
jgi:hypothetical protein